MTPREQKIKFILRWVFVLIPLLAGIDKFFNLITDWEQYVSPLILNITHLPAHAIMLAAGPGEIIVGLLVLFHTRIGSIAFIAMILGIVADLLTMPKQLHIVSLDLSLAVCAICLFMLSAKESKENPQCAETLASS